MFDGLEPAGGRDIALSPAITSPFELCFQEGRTVLCLPLREAPELVRLLYMPS